MTTLVEAGKPGTVHTVYPGVLSLYLAVPLDPCRAVAHRGTCGSYESAPRHCELLS